MCLNIYLTIQNFDLIKIHCKETENHLSKPYSSLSLILSFHFPIFTLCNLFFSSQHFKEMKFSIEVSMHLAHTLGHVRESFLKAWLVTQREGSMLLKDTKLLTFIHLRGSV